MQDETILCISTCAWDSLWRDRQQIMSRIARQNRVLFFEPGRNPELPLGASLRSTLPYYGVKRWQRRGDNLLVIPTPSSIPYARRHLPHAVQQMTLPAIASLNAAVLIRHIRWFMAELDVTDPILWLYEPRHVGLIGQFGEKLVCYFNYDEYANFVENQRISDLIWRYDRLLTQRADLVFTTGRAQWERRVKLNPNTYHIPNGVNFDLFNTALDPATPLPPDLASVRPPMIGYAGWLGHQIDANLLNRIAEGFPDCSLVLVGPDEMPQDAAYQRLRGAANVWFLGRKEPTALPGYLKAFDVALIPYRLEGYTLTAYPTKLHEYLAAGKAIVATALPELRPFDDLVCITGTDDEMLAGIRAALHGSSPQAIAARVATASRNTWDQRVATIYEMVDVRARTPGSQAGGAATGHAPDHPDVTVIGWVHFHRRTELLAQHLGASLHFIQCGQSEQFVRTPWRYAVQTWRTWRVLLRERPRIVLVQNPPIFCALLASVYARLFHGHFVIDSHTGAFIGRRWSWSVPLHRLLSRSALLTIVHNRAQEAVVADWDCPFMVIGYTPGDYPVMPQPPLHGRFNVAVISSFRGDEPTAAMFQAGGQLPAVAFYFTGDWTRLDPQVLAMKPDNCHLLGYLPYDRFVGLLQAADAVMTLTDRDETLLMGAFETVSIGKPLITSDWPVLRAYFSLGAVHIPNTAAGICAGVERAERECTALQADMLRLRDQLQAEWDQNMQRLQAVLAGKRP
jgi:glycosyltransferase involved in cell wall biosynthesis